MNKPTEATLNAEATASPHQPIVMRLFVWTGFCPDYNNGLAFAIAENIEKAQQEVIKAKGYEPYDWGTVQELSVDESVAFCVSGGG